MYTDKDEAVLRFLEIEPAEAAGPTAIGLALGYSYQSASAAVMPSLKKLVKLGLVKRIQRGKYQVGRR